jgi:hypothetical protein
MLEDKVKLMSEALARAVNRRSFIKQLGGSIAAGVSALMLGPSLAKASALAGAGAGSSPMGTPSCSPPGPYCNIGTGILSGCRGGHCYQHLNAGQVYTCKVYYTYYNTGCWTTAVSGGYWTCCDCRCSNNSTCGCASFNPGNSINDPTPL